MEEPSPFPPAPDPPRSRRRRTMVVVSGVLAVVVAAATALVVFRPAGPPAAVAQAEPTRPPMPYELVKRTLADQAAALVKGDEKGWLAPVDPKNRKLTARYRMLYQNLRALDVTHAEYQMTAQPAKGKGVVPVAVELFYCLSAPECVNWRESNARMPPSITHRLDLKAAGGRYRIVKFTEVEHYRDAGGQTPVPWEDTQLAVVRGNRVTVAGPRSQAKNLKRVLKAAEQAATVADRFAARLNNPQRRYRIYLADRKGWKTWYGGESSDWAVGYAIPLRETGTDVVLQASRALDSYQQMTEIITHEFGHVVTLDGVTIRDNNNAWLSEGIAEYIGANAKAARTTDNRYAVGAAFRGNAPKSIVSAIPSASTSAAGVDRFYGMGHFAVDCFADKYGEPDLFRFIDLVLRQGKKRDPASRTAFGKPFDAVDKACVSWIRGQV